MGSKKVFSQFICVCFLLAFFGATEAMGQESKKNPETKSSVVQLLDLSTSYRLNNDVLILEEPNGSWQIEDAIQRKDQFTKPLSDNPNYGFGKHGLWFYTKIANRTDTDFWMLDISFAQNDYVDFYLVQNGEVTRQEKQGKLTNTQSNRYPAFKINIEPDQQAEIFIRVHTPTQNRVVPIDIQSSTYFYFLMTIDQTLWGIYYGGLLMLLLYTLVLYVTNKEISLLTYVFYLSTAIFFELVWGGHLNLFLHSPFTQWIGQHSDLAFILTGLSAGAFTLTFLDATQSAPRITRVVKVFIAIEIILAAASLTGLLPSDLQNYLVYLVSIGAISSYLYAGFESYLNSYKPARYFAFAWTVLLMGAMVGLLGLIGVLPSNFLTTYCFQIGVFFESAFFALALLEKSRHQLEMEVQAATEDLMNNLELIEEQNVRLDIARKDALKASRIKSQFLANMSHEIRTPLNAILGFSKELSSLALPSDKQEYIQIINTSATNLLAIVNDVLDFSKIEAGKLQISRESFSPNELLEEIVFLYAKTARKKGLTFTYQRVPLPERLIGDPVRIKQVLTNLISNAIKFTQEGHIALSVKSKKLKNGKLQLEFEVEDSGIGIEPKDKAKLFRAFSQLDETLNRSYQGTGLGLVISQQLVQLMRGSIRFNSLYGIGSQFQIKITCGIDSDKMDMTKETQWNNKRLAILDANYLTRRTKAKLFCNLGAKVTSIESTDFLNSLEEHFDCLIVDINSFNFDNLDALLKLCKTFRTDDRILMHDNNRSIEREADLRKVFDRFVEKPIPLSRIKTLFENKEQEDVNLWQHRLASLPAINVLAVDDMELNLKLLKTWLADSPINLVLCTSGREALNLCEHMDFDLILMDVQMPDMDGVETSKQIRKTRVNQGTPIIAVTAHAFREEKERLLNSGMDDYLAKPLDLGSLINTIKRWSIGAGEEPTPIHSDLADFDWQQAVDKANGSESIANDMFYDFLEQLPSAFAAIQKAAEDNDWKTMQAEVHRLHGASCYTGVPKLQYLCCECEKLLKEDKPESANMCLPAIQETVETLLKNKEDHS